MAANTVKKGSLRKAPFVKKLAAPYALKWPSLDQGSCSAILDKIKSVFPPMLTQKPISKKQRELLTEAKSKGSLKEQDRQQLKDIEERQQLMKVLVVGINEVTRGLEKDQLQLVLVCRSLQPAVMTNHLMLLGATRHTPVLGIHNLSATLSPLLRTKHIAALGFKKVTVPNVFSPLVEYILPQVPNIAVPWLEKWDDGNKGSQIKNSSEQETEKSQEKPGNTLSSEICKQKSCLQNQDNAICSSESNKSESNIKSTVSGLKRRNNNDVDELESREKKQKTDESSAVETVTHPNDEGNNTKIMEVKKCDTEEITKPVDSRNKGNTKKQKKKRKRKLKSLLDEGISNMKMTYAVPEVKFLVPRAEKKKKKKKK